MRHFEYDVYRDMKEYYHVVEDMVRHEDLNRRQQAIMEDKIIMNEGLPQKYGSQFQGDQLYEVDNMDSVIQRRKNLGVMSIEEYMESNLSK